MRHDERDWPFAAMERLQESSGALRRSAGRVTEGTMVVHLRHLAQRKHDVFTIATA